MQPAAKPACNGGISLYAGFSIQSAFASSQKGYSRCPWPHVMRRCRGDLRLDPVIRVRTVRRIMRQVFRSFNNSVIYQCRFGCSFASDELAIDALCYTARLFYASRCRHAMSDMKRSVLHGRAPPTEHMHSLVNITGSYYIYHVMRRHARAGKKPVDMENAPSVSGGSRIGQSAPLQ